ncbi:triose-phosphate isomerase [Duganella violaceipulchra]|uniref:Triosephosphate isomerase n=1 Tax=Duganella violaceipulchra TaxID=2849652 RepID=A0AA41HAA8_9BURK|nr:triose-phosphate isomerase [Duganella violaceicalia]MBV6323594.1 triose-phosphate isomerase [Duganella violaceicalia]MCP2008949.1 triosephosphate isomerase [Duganella violaceicalia]
MRRKLVIGNWKMNGNRAGNTALLSGILAGLNDFGADCAVCVPAPYLAQCQAELQDSPLAWGGQDLSVHASGAYTGEVSAGMLVDFGSRYVLCGHSERRAYHKEGSELVAQKTVAALAAGLTPVVCVGETLEQREAGETEAVICGQLQAVLDVIVADDLAKIVVAYEPVWAIGTGKTATPQIAQDAHAFLRARMAQKNAPVAAGVQILYGGSMKPDNAKELMAQQDIDGGLIGGAALKAVDFLGIIQAI